MKVLELSVQADAEGAEAAAAAVNEYAYGGAVIEQTVTPESGQTLDPARPYTVRAFFFDDDRAVEKRQAMERAIWHLAQLRPFGPTLVRELEEADWADAWKRFYPVLHVGDRIVIKPSWLEYLPRPGEAIVELDPGMAFGTGLHPTTRLCLAAVENYLHPGQTMLDVGTGSGILAIAAAKLGARFVDARDTDLIAVETASRNVQVNGMKDVVKVAEGSVSRADEPLAFDLVTVNIFAETIIELAPALAFHVETGGHMIASGILVGKTDRVKCALESVGIRTIEVMTEEDWVAIACERSK